MRKFFSLSPCFLFCLAILFSFKSFATDCPSGVITSSITCTGNISTSDLHVYGINLNNSSSTNNSKTVNVTGNVTATGVSSSHGINSDNSSGARNTNTVNITGNITTIGPLSFSRGIYLTNTSGANNTSVVNMTGDIASSGYFPLGITLNNNSGASNTNTVNMIGNVTATSSMSDAYGISLHNVNGANNTNILNVTGNIMTSGYDPVGLYLSNILTTGSTNTVNMTGNISVSDIGSINTTSGILLWNAYDRSSINNLNMTGNIVGTGNYLAGISSMNYGNFGSSSSTNMTGNIMLSGNNSWGIYFLNFLLDPQASASNTLNMTGNITTSGNNSYGIYLDNRTYASSSGSNTVNITGHISATGSDSYAIYVFNANSTGSNIVQFNKGSSIIGAISGTGSNILINAYGSYPANNFLKLNLGAGASYSFATTGFTVQDLNGRPMVTGSAHAAGVGNVSTASQSLYERTSQITQSLDDRLRTHDLKQQPSQDFWINTYYSDSNRGGQGLSGSNLSFNQYRSGIMAGFNVKNSYTPTELIVNYEHGQLNIDEGNQGISSNSVLAGALFPDIKKLLTGTLSAKAMVGYSDFSGDRKVLTNDIAFNGSRNVTANYQSSHLTVGSAWTKTLYQTDKVILDTLVGIDLNTQHINSYSESDLFKWNSRTINQLQERVTLGMEIKPLVKPLTLFGRVGVERRDLISGENQNYAINNTAVSYTDSNQRNTYATLNAGAYYPLTLTVKAYAQVRYYDSTKDIDSLSGSIGISGQF